MFDRNLTQRIKSHMQVVGSDDRQLGTVDRVDGNELKLVKDNQGQHHYIPLDWIRSVDDKVRVDRSNTDAMREWKTKPS